MRIIADKTDNTSTYQCTVPVRSCTGYVSSLCFLWVPRAAVRTLVSSFVRGYRCALLSRCLYQSLSSRLYIVQLARQTWDLISVHPCLPPSWAAGCVKCSG
ncbi:unnamed protein product, partial [Tuber aestivum]